MVQGRFVTVVRSSLYRHVAFRHFVTALVVSPRVKVFLLPQWILFLHVFRVKHVVFLCGRTILLNDLFSALSWNI